MTEVKVQRQQQQQHQQQQHVFSAPCHDAKVHQEEEDVKTTKLSGNMLELALSPRSSIEQVAAILLGDSLKNAMRVSANLHLVKWGVRNAYCHDQIPLGLADASPYDKAAQRLGLAANKRHDPIRDTTSRIFTRIPLSGWPRSQQELGALLGYMQTVCTDNFALGRMTHSQPLFRITWLLQEDASSSSESDADSLPSGGAHMDTLELFHEFVLGSRKTVRARALVKQLAMQERLDAEIGAGVFTIDRPSLREIKKEDLGVKQCACFHCAMPRY